MNITSRNEILRGYPFNGDLLATHTYTNSTDAVTETYAYDLLGNRISTTDALGNTTYRTYDPLGNLTAVWGATYPVRYTYDTQGRRTSLTTFRTTGAVALVATDGDTTTWTYDPYTGNCLSKTCADANGTAVASVVPGKTALAVLPSGITLPSGYEAPWAVAKIAGTLAHPATLWGREAFSGDRKSYGNDLSDAKVEIVDVENLNTPFWFIKSAENATLNVIGKPEAVNLPKGWQISASSSGAKVQKVGFSIYVR